LNGFLKTPAVMKHIFPTYFIAFFFIMVLIPQSIAQDPEPWSLEDCVRYALENNIQVKQQQLNAVANENILKQSKINLTPNLNGGFNHSFSRGRSLDQSTYTFQNQDVNSESFSLISNMTVFNGLQQVNTIKQNKYNLMASMKDVEKLKNDISLNIALAYLQILLNKELLDVARNQLEISHLQIERTSRLVQAGSLPEGNLLEIRAQAAREEIQVVNAQNQLDISYLTLTQILDLDSTGGFEIETPDLDSLINENYVVPPVETVYSDALNILPQIKSAEWRLKSTEMDLKLAQGARYPSISLSGNYNTIFSSTRRKFTFDPDDPLNPIEEPYPYLDQLWDNRNWGVGLSVSVPIYNRWLTNTYVSNARLNIEGYELEVKNVKNMLYKEIQQAYADAIASLKRFRASETAVTSVEESFRYTEQKYNVGLVNSVDYNTSKNQLTQTQSELLQAKYEFIFSINVIEFYRGRPIVL
jgi:outer membrane protein